MPYVDVQWLSQSEEYPFRLVSELDEQRYETRKLEFFRNGKVGFASASGACGGTRLGELPVPPLKEINADLQFVGVSIQPQEFEALWEHHATSGA
jgi:hypothetical protein